MTIIGTNRTTCQIWSARSPGPTHRLWVSGPITSTCSDRMLLCSGFPGPNIDTCSLYREARSLLRGVSCSNSRWRTYPDGWTLPSWKRCGFMEERSTARTASISFLYVHLPSMDTLGPSATKMCWFESHPSSFTATHASTHVSDYIPTHARDTDPTDTGV